MKQALKKTLAALLLAAPLWATASGSMYEPANIDPRDQVSLQRGAQIFVNNCLSCHSAAVMRFNRLKDIGLTEEEIKKNLMFTTDKIGDVMQSSMSPADAKKWFGAAPPDLSLIARARGSDYIYAYLRGFYKDPTRPTGWNKVVFDKVGMPHALWEQQGVQAVKLDAKGQPVFKEDSHGNKVPDLYWESAGKLTRMTKDGKVITKEYDDYARDLTNFMAYMSEPAQVQRKQIGYIVLMFLLAIMLPFAYFLKKEYWKDVH